MENHDFKLSGHELKMAIPYGNCFDIPDPQGEFSHNADVYNYEHIGDELEAFQLIGKRNYKYTGFIGKNLGRIALIIASHLTRNTPLNLTDIDQLQKHIAKVTATHTETWNKKADEFAQIKAPDQYDKLDINGTTFLKYSHQSATKNHNHYAAPLSENCYLAINFSYRADNDPEAPWLKCARELETTVMNSVLLKRSPSLRGIGQKSLFSLG